MEPPFPLEFRKNKSIGLKIYLDACKATTRSIDLERDKRLHVAIETKVVSPIWLCVASMSLALAWLLPNHYPPWMTFHSDAWMAIVLVTMTSVLLMRVRRSVGCHWSAILVACTAFVPMAQYVFGLVPFVGIAWINSAYLVGLLLALLAGAHWEKISNGQCADFVFLAIGWASIVSVGIELHQWLELDSLEFWINRVQYRYRPYGNLGQPNQLATLLVLGLLGCGWGIARKQLAAWAGLLMAAFLLLGIALTQSRTGWLNVSILFLAMLLYGWARSSKKLIWASVGLGLYFFVCILGLPLASDVLGLGSGAEFSTRNAIGIRPVVWRMFLDAILQKPFFGFGWGQTMFAHLDVAADHPFTGFVLFQAHNLFLDLLIWNGVPVGLFLSVALVWWFVIAAKAAKDVNDAILLLSLLVLGIHAMFEFPLHYAYFLLPAGLMVGVLNVRLGFRPPFVVTSWAVMGVWLTAAAMLAVTIRDYARVESSFFDLRFEKARIHTDQPGSAPDVWVLTHLRDLIKYSRMEARANLTANELNWMRNVTKSYPSPVNVREFAMTLALNKQNDEAQQWLRRLCKTYPKEHCRGTKVFWAEQSLKEPAIAAVPWPMGAE